MSRLPAQDHHWIDQADPVRFSFEGRNYQGYRGDVLSSALWAEGVRVLGRSFKYHRPRGIYSLAGHDANVIVDDGQRTNIRGDQLLIENGMQLRGVNTSGGLERDRLRWMGMFSRFLPVGFYYKAFHTPRRLFPFFEKQMRKVAGLGAIHPGHAPVASPKDYDFCDVLVVGSGPAGLAAATAAADCGLKVMLVEEQPRAGGSLCWQWTADPVATQLLSEQLAAVQDSPNITLRCETQAAGCYADNWVALVDRRRLTKLRARAIVLATGVIEQPAVFQNNDLPGVMLASAAQRLLHQYAVSPCRRPVIMTANDEGYQLANELADLEIPVAGIVDLRCDADPTTWQNRTTENGIPLFPAHAVYKAHPGRGKKSIKAVTICRLDDSAVPDRRDRQHLRCDGVLMSVGWQPNSALISQAGGRFEYSDELNQLVPSQLPDELFVAGRANGIYGLADQVADGRRAGLAAARQLGTWHQPLPETTLSPERVPSHAYPIFSHPGKKNFVDLDEDVHLADIVNAHQEGYDNVELLKRFTTVGMGPSQGKISNFPAVRILARLNNASIAETGTTTSRPFYQPVPLGHLAGRRFHANRRTPLDQWHRDAAAVMVHAGAWLRPEYYRRDDHSRDELILAEAQAVRDSVGMIDLSTLGKIHVCGPQAVEFLEQVYTGRFKRQRNGTLRYAIALDETGVIIEDGIVARLADDHFYLSATSSGAATFYRGLQRWAIQLGLDVTLSNATGQMAAFNLAGQASRKVLAQLTTADISAEAFPYLAARQVDILGTSALLIRVGFVGELGYEIHLPASQAAAVWEELMQSGQDQQIRPFGVEAQRLLRLEKGHLIVGHDTDALTLPSEADVEWAVAADKPFFVGGRSLQIIAQRPLTRKLVGFRFADQHPGPWPEECQLVFDGTEMVGRITSISRQSTLGHAVAMGFVKPELASAGTKLEVRVSDGSRVVVAVSDLPFYDPQNSRQQLESD